MEPCCVCGAVLGSWEAAGGKADTESEAAVSSVCGCGTWGWQHCGGAAESEPQPIGLSRGGCLAPAGCLLWDRRGGGPCCVHGSPQFAALLRLIPQGSRAGAPPPPPPAVVCGLEVRGPAGLAVPPSHGAQECPMPPVEASP